MKREIEIRFGELGDEFVKRNSDIVNVNKQPSGLNFYTITWEPEDCTQVLIENGVNSIKVSNILSISANEDAHTLNRTDSFQDISLGAGLSNQNLISHDQARLVLYTWLQDAMSAGWRPVHYDSSPRIFGKERLYYALNQDDLIGLDANYVPTLDEWMRIKDSTHWIFYANHIFLDLSFQRDIDRLDPKKPGAYFVAFEFTTELEYFRSYAGPDHRTEWKKFLPAARNKAHEIRRKIEAELKAKGIAIDESYQDPVPPP